MFRDASLARCVSDRFVVKTDTAFDDVIPPVRRLGPDAPKAGSTPRSRALYCGLHREGHAHSVECWRDGRLVGGLYGVRLGAAFFGESMFSLERDASKVALVHLVARLKRGRFTLLDAQFLTEHLRSSALSTIPRNAYLEMSGGRDPK